MNFGGQEMILVLVLVLILFGGKKIPELMRGVGKGMGELQKGIEEGKRTLQTSMNTDDDDDHKVHEIKPRPAENTLPFTPAKDQDPAPNP
jgi:sec-independent protein translocase protein TatA